MTGIQATKGSAKPWSDEEDDLIVKWWTEGASTRAIGHRLGRGRNSIAGRMHRLKQRGRLQARSALLSGACAPEWIKPVPKSRKPKAKPRPAPAPEVQEQGSLFQPETAPNNGVSLLDLRWWHCRSVTSQNGGPYGLAIYCGKEKTKGKSFCSEHAAIYYVPPKPRQRGKSNGR